ncbi:DegT/DnrJ/EryC1/StrS family aminotransferase [Paenibacillus hemerocallicola]|uniref:DegT/DnrJ/EryC1/StrS family aminotransferase n=1 Tax=Paenibacillus hemerocallicola TaxID=1172614 RepID=A0A5C4SXY5_9BACL|nr:DegT/DnrJ/EryC1/StrS family aminotransferase [Paenibacillus hemerocallicola]TNJ60490.1 DegT/DnrJ/EryC1/StrS family aminotransferase [Paenibacillus hemerocallicola]
MSKLAIDGGTPIRTKPFPEWPIFDELEERLVLEVVRSGKWGGTGRVKLPELEEKFAAIHDAKHAVSIVNGTVAITIALQAAGVQPGDEVIMPPYTFIATASSALMFGAIPVFVDVEPDTLLLDPEKVEAAITSKTKAIIAVHIAGSPANLTRLKTIAAKHGLRLIEDSAQAVGAKWDGVGVGAQGDFGTFSFQSSKNINAGEGGMILTNDQELADHAWSLANVGRIRQGGWYQHETIGWNLRMTELQAAILLGQLSRLDGQMELRERNAKLLTGLLDGTPGVRTLRRDPQATRHAQHLFMFRIEPELADRIDKAEVIRKLNAEGIPVSSGYVSLNQNKAVISETKKWTGEDRVYSCPNSERACDKEILWLHQNVLLADEADMRDIADGVRKVMASCQ